MAERRESLLELEIRPHMSEGELALLKKYSQEVTGTVLEFGAGGSTVLFAESGVSQLITVEADEEWIQKLLIGKKILRTWAKKKRWLPLFANIGRVKEWSEPVDKKTYNLLNYHQNIWDNINISDVNFIFIDGRFRVACALQWILRSNRKYAPIAIHDFWNRDHYFCLLDYFDVLDKAETMAILVRKNTIEWNDCAICLLEHLFDWR
jgi:hypothetical protein